MIEGRTRGNQDQLAPGCLRVTAMGDDEGLTPPNFIFIDTYYRYMMAYGRGM